MVWSLVRPVATQLGRVYHILPSTLVGSVMTDNEEGNEWVSQKITFHGIGAEGIKKLITIVRGASMQWPVGMCPREFAVTMSIFSRRLCVRSRPSLHIRLGSAEGTPHILAADVDCLAFFGWGREVI